MRVLVFHGYLLRGTGSNVYNANLVSALLRLGHEVHILCQDRHAEELEFVGAVGDWDGGELVVRQVGDAGCTVYRPNIGKLLPVYVPDTYEGLEARPFQELNDEELGRYIAANVAAVREVAEHVKPDVALANHLVMGPATLARALAGTDVPYAVKVHGSALEYTVKPYPRFLPYAREGVARAKGVLVGSRHTAESLWAALEDPGLAERTRLGPPGVDVKRFRPHERDAAIARLRILAARVADEAAQREPAGVADARSAFDRDSGTAAVALAVLLAGAENDRLVAFVGKLIIAKGIDLLLAAWPLVLRRVPEARLVVVGFGAFESAVQGLIVALSEGDLAGVRKLAERGRGGEGGDPSRLEYLLAFLDWLERSDQREGYLAAARAMDDRVVLTGRLEHDELADVLPLCEAMVVPSTFPESFGMVAVEAAACGCFPIVAAHSGLAEVSRVLVGEMAADAGRLASFEVGPAVVRSIAECVLDWLNAPDDLRQSTREVLVGTARGRYAWENVARGVIAAARGELDSLPSVGA